MTVLEGLTLFRIPCATVLSVAGLLCITALFPLGMMFILGVKACRITPTFLTFLTLIPVILRVLIFLLLVHPCFL